jgi:hypothetical protein
MAKADILSLQTKITCLLRTETDLEHARKTIAQMKTEVEGYMTEASKAHGMCEHMAPRTRS